MKKDLQLILDKINELNEKTTLLEKAVAFQSEEIESLKNQLASLTTVTIEEEGKESTESFGNLILDEIIVLKKQLEGFSAEGLRGVVNDVAALKNRLEAKAEGGPEFSLHDLKEELIKLADMMSV